MSSMHISNWQTGFLNVMPAVQTHARIQFRHLPSVHREEAIQEAIAAACVAYQQLAVQGRLHVACPSSIATNAVRRVRSGRHVGGRQDGAKDVLSRVCQHRHGVRVQSCDVRRSERGNTDWKQLVIPDRKGKAPIPDSVAFRVDFERWLWTLTRRDRRVIAAFIRGDGTFAVANRMSISPSRVSQLRHTYQQLWLSFHDDGAVMAKAA